MPTPAARALKLAEGLVAAGFTPEVEERESHIVVQVEEPDDVSEEALRAALRVLASADRFGHEVSATDGRSIWAAVQKGTPATAATARGHGHQL